MLSDAHDRLVEVSHNNLGVLMFNPASPTASDILSRTSSPFERLPIELRIEIYKVLFRGKMYPAIRTAGRRRWTGHLAMKRFGDWGVISMLQTCRLFRSEAKWIFKHEVVVAFTPRGLAIASVMLASTMLDTMELRQIALVDPHPAPTMLANIRLACPRLEAVHLLLYDARSSSLAPLRTLIDEKDSNIGKIASRKSKLRAVFLSIVRYDWLSKSNVADFTKAVSEEDYCGPQVLFSSPVIFEQQPGHDLAPDSNGGYLVLDPKLKTVEWEFKGSLIKGRYTLKSTPRGGSEWSFEMFD